MTTALEALAAKTPMGADLDAGVNAISYNQEITFNLYRRLVLPLDGYVFWIKAFQNNGGSSASAILNGSPLDTWGPNFVSSAGASRAITLKVKGSLHYSTDQRQDEDATYTVNRVIFTALSQVTDLNQTSPTELYIGEFQGVRFAFSSRGRYYQQAGLHHYVGDAIYAPMASQVVDNPQLLNAQELIVSNSLPAWLALNSYTAPWPIPLPQAAFTLFPSFLSPSNLEPIYGTVHIVPDGTEGIAAGPLVNSVSSQYQLARDRVTVTLYGCNNALAGSFLLNVLQYSLNTAHFGIMNIPIIKDDKRIQSELTLIGQKKRIEFEVCYYQNVVRNIAHQLILEASIVVVPDDGPPLSTALA